MTERTASIDAGTARTIVLTWFIVPALVLLSAFYLLWGITLREIQALLLSPFTIVGWVAAGILLHEVVHAIGFLGGGASPRSIKFQLQLRTLTASVSCSECVPAGRLKLACLLPLFTLGFGVALFALATGSFPLALWSAFIITSTAGDVALYCAIRSVPGNCPARLHGEEIGCLYYLD